MWLLLKSLSNILLLEGRGIQAPRGKGERGTPPQRGRSTRSLECPQLHSLRTETVCHQGAGPTMLVLPLP